MEPMRCRDLHFIAAIKGGFMTKFCNVDSHGKQALVFKTLRDVCEAEDAKRAASNSTLTSPIKRAIDCERVKVEGSCLPFADRTVREIDHTSNEFVHHGDHDETFDKLTLRQLKKMCQGKKRKISSAIDWESKEVRVKVESAEDEFDLKESLSSWKSKLAKKKTKAKRKCITSNVTKSEVSLSIKSEPILDSENLTHADRDLVSLIYVKSEDSESEFLACSSPISLKDDSSINSAEEETLCNVIADRNQERVEYENKQVVLCREEDLNFIPNNVSRDSSSEDLEMNECNNCKQTEESQNFVVDEVSYDHLESLEPIALLPANSEEIVHVSNQNYSSEDFLISPILNPNIEEDFSNHFSWGSSPEITSANETSDMLSCSVDSSLVIEISRQSSCSLGIEDLDMVVNNNHKTRENLPFHQQIGSLSCAEEEKSGFSGLSRICFSPDDDVNPVKDNTVIEEHSFTCSNSGDPTKDFVNPGNHVVSSEDNTPTGVRKQPPVSTNADSELLQNPAKLPSTRKTISPTSQEQLLLAMKSEELFDDPDRYKCKEKLDFGKQPESSPPTAGSSLAPASTAESSIQSGQAKQKKIIISTSQILKKSKNEKRGFPSEGNLGGQRETGSVPCVSSECTSVKSCSESAIAFSQRQMRDIESLASRLVNELKNMKDIVEEKLLFESYRNLSLKNDADEVKTAIKNATKAEETATKWLAMMARDCNRFCKITRLNQNSPAAPKNEICIERKKITFADEAGGMLCHVKFFENGTTPPESCSAKEDDQIS